VGADPTRTPSPGARSRPSRPSTESSTPPRASGATWTSTVLVGGNIRGRNERLRGQIGVNRIDGWEGWIRGPDAEREYAVEPVGVERMSPSACTLVRIQWVGETMASVRNTPSMKMFSLVKCGERPLWRITSFMAWVIGSVVSVKSSTERFPLFRVEL